jgi:hypothetical protein
MQGRWTGAAVAAIRPRHLGPTADGPMMRCFINHAGHNSGRDVQRRSCARHWLSDGAHALLERRFLL